MKETTSIMIDFREKAISKIAFTKTREEAERIERELGMRIYFPSDLANFRDKESIFVLLDS